jgi:AcrR family transcriptional regulator
MSSTVADERPRVGRQATREALIEATAQIMLAEGYAAGTSRRVAAKAGVKPALVQYYFPSMDDLFVAVLRDKAEDNLARQGQTIAQAQLLHAPGQLNNVHGAQLFTEFLTMANHRKAIRSEIVAYATRFRDLEEGVVTLALTTPQRRRRPVPRGGDVDDHWRPGQHGASRTGLGITHGHDQAPAFIERCLERFEMLSWERP